MSYFSSRLYPNKQNWQFFFSLTKRRYRRKFIAHQSKFDFIINAIVLVIIVCCPFFSLALAFVSFWLKFFSIVSIFSPTVAWFTFDLQLSGAVSGLNFSNDNRTVSADGWEHCVALGTVGFSRGVHYWEFTIDRYTADTDPAFGVARIDVARDKMLGKWQIIFIWMKSTRGVKLWFFELRKKNFSFIFFLKKRTKKLKWNFNIIQAQVFHPSHTQWHSQCDITYIV